MADAPVVGTARDIAHRVLVVTVALVACVMSAISMASLTSSVANGRAPSTTTGLANTYDPAPNLAPAAVVEAHRSNVVARPVADALGPSLASSAELSAPEAAEQLALFNVDDFVAGGVNRAAQHGANWSTGSLGDAVSQLGSNPALSWTGQKTVLTGGNGMEVIIDRAGGYFRLRGPDGAYLMLDGSPVPANVPILRPDGTSAMSDRGRRSARGATERSTYGCLFRRGASPFFAAAAVRGSWRVRPALSG